MDRDGGAQTNRSNNPSYDMRPAFSPDGKKIASRAAVMAISRSTRWAPAARTRSPSPTTPGSTSHRIGGFASKGREPRRQSSGKRDDLQGRGLLPPLRKGGRSYERSGDRDRKAGSPDARRDRGSVAVLQRDGAGRNRNPARPMSRVFRRGRPTRSRALTARIACSGVGAEIP